MSNSIEISNLSKVYYRGVSSENMFWKQLFQSHKNKEEFHSLKDINLDIAQGETLALIGPNGAGKSTLLKVLSRITPPTTGTVKIRGTIASLLEVGTGFHPELTGAENVFLNGTILGMSKQEIKSKFDEIVEFSGISNFINTPVKQYSTGMKVRLGFAVAAHLRSDILVVDEVLAVGDAEFQQKCLNRIDSISQEDGRTVILVSHQLGTIQNICNKTLWLSGGEIKEYGDTNIVLENYKSSYYKGHLNLGERKERMGSNEILLSKIHWKNQLLTNSPNTLEINLKKLKPINGQLIVRVNIHSENGGYLTSFSNEFNGEYIPIQEEINLEIDIERIPFLTGKYFMNVICFVDWVKVDHVQYAYYFEVGGHSAPIQKIDKSLLRNSVFTPQAWRNIE